MTPINEVILSKRKFGNIEYEELKLSTDDKPRDTNSDPKSKRHILIIGAGVSALLPAWILLDKGHHVTIIAEEWAWTRDFDKSRITSQIAGALWEFPPGGCGLTEIESPGKGFATVEHYREWSLQSYEFYKEYHKVSNSFEKEGFSFGLKLAKLHQFFYSDLFTSPRKDNEEYLKFKALKWAADEGRIDDVETWNSSALKTEFESVVNVEFDQERSGKFKSAYTHKAPIINTDKAMSYLMALVKTKGAVLETRKFEGLIRDFGKNLLKEHHAHAIINATGLGAKELAGDKDVYPVRGAIKRIDNTRKGQFRHLNDAYLVPAQLDQKGHPTKTVFIVPRSDDVLYVGSIIQPGNDQALSENSVEVEAMWDRACDFIPRLHHAGLDPGLSFAQGLRPFTKKNVKVRADTEADFPLVHNYGHGGSGWTLGVGTARCAVYIVEQLTKKTVEPSLKKTMESLKINVSTLENIIVQLKTAENNVGATYVEVKAANVIKERVSLYCQVLNEVNATAKDEKSLAGLEKICNEELKLDDTDKDDDKKNYNKVHDLVKRISKPGDMPRNVYKFLEGFAERVKNELAKVEEALNKTEPEPEQQVADTDSIKSQASKINDDIYNW